MRNALSLLAFHASLPLQAIETGVSRLQTAYILRLFLYYIITMKIKVGFLKIIRNRNFLFFVSLFILLAIFNIITFNQKYQFIYQIIKTLYIIIISWALIKLTFLGRKKLETFLMSNKEKNKFRDRRLFTQIIYIEKIFIIIIVFLSISAIFINYVSLKNIGVGLLTSAGAVSIIVGIAAQKSLSNILAGFQIAFTELLRIGDAVVVENEFGIIEEITLTYVTVRLWDWRRFVLPITYFIEKPFQNWTKKAENIIGSIYIYVDYSCDITSLRLELTNILKETDLWDGQVKVVQVTTVKTDCIKIRILVSASNASRAWDLRCYVREKIINYIKEKQPKCLPQRRINFINTLKTIHNAL